MYVTLTYVPYKTSFLQYGNKMKSESTEAGATNFSFDDDDDEDAATEDYEGIFEQNNDSSSSNTNSNSDTNSVSFSSVTEDSASRVDALTSGLKESADEVPPLEEGGGDLYWDIFKL